MYARYNCRRLYQKISFYFQMNIDAKIDKLEIGFTSDIKKISDKIDKLTDLVIEFKTDIAVTKQVDEFQDEKIKNAEIRLGKLENSKNKKNNSYQGIGLLTLIFKFLLVLIPALTGMFYAGQYFSAVKP